MPPTVIPPVESNTTVSGSMRRDARLSSAIGPSTRHRCPGTSGRTAGTYKPFPLVVAGRGGGGPCVLTMTRWPGGGVTPKSSVSRWFPDTVLV